MAAATPYAQANNLEGEITAGRNGRYTSDIYNLIGIAPTALEPMGFALQSGSWPTNTPASEKATKLQVLVGSSTGYNFQDSRKSYNSPKRYRYEGQTDANGKELPPFVDIDKDKMTLTIKTGEGSTEKSRSWELEIVGVLEPDGAKGYWTQSGIVLRIQDMKMLQKIYNDMTKTKEESKSYDQVYVKVDDLSNVTDVETAIHDLGFTNTYSMNQQREEMQKQVMNSQMIFGGIAAVSLLVAAINIINTMTMAIYERTREIGVMKVLGCELGNIRTMFLLESSTIGFIGGLIGLGISLIASFVLNNLSTLGQGLDLSGRMGGGVDMGGGGGAISQHKDNVDWESDIDPVGVRHYENYQSQLHEMLWKQFSARKYLWAEFIWCMFDFASYGRTEGDTKSQHDKGLCTRERIPKDVYFFYRSVWSSEKTVYITERRHEFRACNVPFVKVYSNADAVELCINDVSHGRISRSELSDDESTVFVWKNIKINLNL